PLSNLDAHLRFEMRDLIRSLQQDMGITTIFVTHDQEEAVVLADRVALILDGQMKQYAEPDVFYKRPVDEATARFFGGHNFIDGTSDGHVFQSPLGPLTLPEGATAGAGKLTFRPENVRIGPGAENTLTAKIDDIMYLGTQTRVKLRVAETEVEAVVNPNEIEAFAKGGALTIHLPASTLWVI
ncbi:MAG: TOBE domain-containing protein, partial [Silicimonas sp.]|nr:TOBE domain-containing protein [Silicimonas sp.]